MAEKTTSSYDLPASLVYGATHLIVRARRIQGYHPSERFFQPDDATKLGYPHKNRVVFNELARAQQTLPTSMSCLSADDMLTAIEMQRAAKAGTKIQHDGKVLPGSNYTPETLRAYQASLMPVADELAGYLYLNFQGAAAALLPPELLKPEGSLAYRARANCQNIGLLIDEHLNLPPVRLETDQHSRIILPRRNAAPAANAA